MEVAVASTAITLCQIGRMGDMGVWVIATRRRRVALGGAESGGHMATTIGYDYTAKDKIVATFGKYFALPKDERRGATWLVHTLETEMRKINLKEGDIAALFAMPFWVINSNAYKLCFWIMAYLLHDPVLYASIHAEIEVAVSKGEMGLDSHLEACERLVAIYNEVLRLNTASASVRAVSSPTSLGNMILSPGAAVLIPYRQLHLNEAIFGDNAREFDANRFLRNRNLSRSPSFRPFGGGTTYCAGVHVARREVLAFVALAIHRYDIQVTGRADRSEQGNFPQADEKKPCLGVLPPVAGDDVRVTVRMKENEAR